jgi:hypothetical protein
MTEAETWETIDELIYRAGIKLKIKIDHPSVSGSDGWGNWTWEDERQREKRIITFKHWKDQYTVDKEVMTVRDPPVLSATEQEEFVLIAYEKIALLKKRSANKETA